jgi:hypothetical protein
VICIYHIVFDGVRRITPIEILLRAVYREGGDFKVDMRSMAERTILKIKVNGRKNNGVKKILVLNDGKLVYLGKEIIVIANYPKKIFHSVGDEIWCINANKIAEKFHCEVEYPLIGAVARTGVTSLSSIILELYNHFDKITAHKIALAVRRGWESVRI